MNPDIVLAFTPSIYTKDWQLRTDGEHNWWYEQRSYTYCRTHKKTLASCWDIYHKSKMWGTHYLNLETGKISSNPSRIYIDYHPKRGEWEHFKTTDDIKASPLYRKTQRHTKQRPKIIS